MTPASYRHTETGGVESRKAGDRSGQHYHKAQTGELREASCFLGLPEPLSTARVSVNSGGLDDKKRTSLWHLDKEKFLALLGFRDMGRDERILPCKLALAHSTNIGSHHKSLEIGPPPLSQTVANFPIVIYTMSGVELTGFGGRGQALIQPPLQTVDLVLTRFKIVPRPVVLHNEQQTTILR